MADSYGLESVFDDCRDKLKTQMDALVAAMATGYDPYPAYTYNYHGPALLQLNAITVDVEGSDLEETGISDGNIYDYDINCSIRVHTAYTNWPVDTAKVGNLLDSVDCWLHTHIHLADDYIISQTKGYTIGQNFAESKTVGGEIKFIVRKLIEHIQI